MPTVELIYDADCPNIESAKAQLLRAFEQVGLPSAYKEWDRGQSESPDYVQQYGSPTVLVDGEDVGGAEFPCGDKACRVYRHGDGGLSGVPSVEMILAKLV